MKVKINILYWNNSDEQRLLNTQLSWHYLLRFCDYVNEIGLIEITPYLFDFSQDKVLDDAIHIPYPKGVYKRSEKINKVIEYHKSEEKYIFSIMDSDIVINPKDYADLSYLIRKSSNIKFYVFNLDDLLNNNGVDFENKNINFNQIETQQRIMNPDLGALFFMFNTLIEEIGGFDERFTIYGGEDNAASYLLQKKGYKKQILPIKPIHLYHDNLLKSVINTKQYQEQLKILQSINN